jgi:hypothetical protein
VGDSVVCYGKVLRFSDTDFFAIGSLESDTQVLTPESLNPPEGDLIVRLVSRGNPLPPVHVGTLAEFDWPLWNSAADPWLNMLVRLPGPLEVVDFPFLNGETDPRATGPSHIFFAADPSCKGEGCDAALVNGHSIADVSAPPEGTILGEVSGIFDFRLLTHQILLRSEDDLVIGFPPQASDAFPIYDNDLAGGARHDSVMVVFDRPVEVASAENVANYSLASGGTIDGIRRLDAPHDNRVVMLIRNGLPDGAPEGITVTGVKSLATGTPMAKPDTREFYNGVLALEMVNVPDPAALAGVPCEDRSRFSGPDDKPGLRASFAGTVTGLFGDLATLQSTPPVRAGLWVQAMDLGLVPGHTYLLAGAFEEAEGETQGTGVVYVRDFGSGPTIVPAIQPIPVVSDDSCDETQLFLTGQDFEGMLVTVDRVQVVASQPPGSNFYVAVPGSAPMAVHAGESAVILDPQDRILVAAEGADLSFEPIEGRIVTVTGVLGRVGGELAIYPPDDSNLFDFGEVPTFTVPLDVSKSATFSQDPDIALGMDGHLFMVWGRVFHETVHSLSQDETQNWAAARSVAHQGIQPAVAVTPSNKFGVLSSTLEALLFKQSTDGGFQIDPLVTIVDPNPTRFSGLTAGMGEHLHAAWERSGEGIYYSGSPSGGGEFGTPFPIALNDEGTHNTMVRIAASTENQVYVLWDHEVVDGPIPNRVLYRRSLDGGATFSPARAVRDESNPLTSTVRLAFLGDAQVGADGTVYVLGLEQGGSDASVVLLRSTNQGATFGLVSELPSPSESGLCPKSFALGGDGSVHALVGVCGTALYYLRSADGGATWTTPVDVSSARSPTIGEPRGAKIILDATGTPVIVWYSSVGGSTEIYSSRLLN